MAYYGTLRAGAIALPMNTLLKEPEADHCLTDSGATVVLAWQNCAETAYAAAAQAGAEASRGEFGKYVRARVAAYKYPRPHLAAAGAAEGLDGQDPQARDRPSGNPGSSGKVVNMGRALLGAIAAVCASAAMAAPAQATLSVSALSVTPSTTQAGGTAGQPGPNITIAAQFSTPNGDSPKDLTIALAPGLLANPTVVPPCRAKSFNAGLCPASSQIGSGYITGTAPGFGLTLSLPTDAYLIQPTGSEVARLGLIVYFFGFPVVTQSAPISIRTTPNVGIDIPLSSIPNQLDGIGVIVNSLKLTIDGTVNGKTFTRNPTSCSAATTTVTVDSYGAPSTSTSQQSAFTPTGCGRLPYAPKLAGIAAQDTGDDGAGFAATITQTYNEADNARVLLTLPASLSPRLSLLASACSNATVSQCPSVGSATVATPLLAAPLAAKIVLVAHTGSIPTLAILIPAPLNLQLNATPILTGSAVQALVVGIPDIPLSSLTLSLPGGPNSLFRAGVHLCSSPQTVSGNFTAWSDATANPSATVAVSGCPVGSTTSSARTVAAATPVLAATPRVIPMAHGRSALAPVGDATVTYANPAHGTQKVTVAVGSGSRRPISSVSIRFLTGLSFNAGKLEHHVRVVLDGRQVEAKATVKRGVLRIAFGRRSQVAIITLSGSALRESGATGGDGRSHHAGKLTMVVTEAFASGPPTVLRLRAIAI